MAKKKVEFYGFEYKQNINSPTLFAFIGEASSVRDLCGVARKDEDNLTNYQRALDETRVKRELRPFFNDTKNCSPTAVVISLHSSPICTISFDSVPEIRPLSSSNTLKKMTIEYEDTEDLSNEKIIELMKQFYDKRLAYGQEEETDEDEQGTLDDIGTGDFEDESDDNDNEIEIGTSKMWELRKKLDDPQNINDATFKMFRDMLKPALVIDGQHRLEGAAMLNDELPFLICAVVNPDWKEEVFQFTVINSKANPIPKPFITSLAGMSLTGNELDDLRERLKKSGVHLWEVDVMQRLGLDASSPFYNMVDFRIKNARRRRQDNSSIGLGYATMKGLGKVWYEGSREGLLRIIEKIITPPNEAPIKKKKLLTSKLKEKYWFELFIGFWQPVKTKFERIWTLNKGELMKAVVLLQFQDVFLIKLAAVFNMEMRHVDLTTTEKEEERAEKVISAYKDIVQDYLDKFDIRHFSREFKASLNHADGKKMLSDYFDAIYDGKQTSNHPIFKTPNV